MLNSGNNIINNLKILVIRLSSIGDIILTTGVIRYIYDKFPNSEIFYLTDKNYSELLEFNPKIKKVIRYDKSFKQTEQQNFKTEIMNELGFEKFDIIIDLHNNLRTIQFRNGLSDNIFKIKKNRLRKLSLVHFKPFYNLIYKEKEQNYHTVNNYFDAVRQIDKIWNKISDLEFQNEIKTYKKSEIFTNNKLENQNIIKLINNSIIIAPGAKHYTKRYPINKITELCLMINQVYPEMNLILVGGKDEIAIGEELVENLTKFNERYWDLISNYIGKMSLLETYNIIEHAKLMITNDTGLMHLASATKTPIIALFGSTTQNLGFTPLSNNYKIIEVDLECRPCTHIGRYKCPKGHFNCMNLIDNQEIINSIKKILD